MTRADWLMRAALGLAALTAVSFSGWHWLVRMPLCMVLGFYAGWATAASFTARRP